MGLICPQIFPVTKMPRWKLSIENVSVSWPPVLLSIGLISSFFRYSRILASDHKVKGHEMWLSRLRIKWKHLIFRIPCHSWSEKQYSGNCFSLSLLHKRVLAIQNSTVSAMVKNDNHIPKKIRDWRFYSQQTDFRGENKCSAQAGGGEKREWIGNMVTLE